jgi:SAM-dependent methyltransferase
MSKKVTELIDLDLNFYRKANRDLKKLSDNDCLFHYYNHGYWEGRQTNSYCTREGLIKSLSGKRALELGPFCNPALAGKHVAYFDVLNREQLVERGKSLGMNTANTPQIDFVSATGDLSSVDAKFDVIFSSHNIEHQPDLIAHLAAASALLEKGGVYALVVPDYRLCFDALLPASRISQVLEAHEERRSLHSMASVIDHRALTTHNDAPAHWAQIRADKPLYTPLDVNRVLGAIEEFRASGDSYLDVHAWQFEPFTFADILGCLIGLGLIDFAEARVAGPVMGRNEFTAQLIK